MRKCTSAHLQLGACAHINFARTVHQRSFFELHLYKLHRHITPYLPLYNYVFCIMYSSHMYSSH